jgi:hypothetical protein
MFSVYSISCNPATVNFEPTEEKYKNVSGRARVSERVVNKRQLFQKFLFGTACNNGFMD